MPPSYHSIRSFEKQKIYLSQNGVFNDIYEGLPSSTLHGMSNQELNILNDCAYITCFSETPDNMLMWSHYANAHQGFCVEYDFNNLSAENHYILEHLEKVNYADQLPSLQLASLIQVMRKKLDPAFQKDPKITEATTETCVEAILTKNSV